MNEFILVTDYKESLRISSFTPNIVFLIQHLQLSELIFHEFNQTLTNNRILPKVIGYHKLSRTVWKMEKLFMCYFTCPPWSKLCDEVIRCQMQKCLKVSHRWLPQEVGYKNITGSLRFYGHNG